METAHLMSSGIMTFDALWVFAPGALLIVETPPVFQSVTLSGGVLAFTWSATPGQSYQVQTTADLASANWTNLGSAITAINATLGASCAIGSASRQFYRILLMP